MLTKNEFNLRYVLDRFIHMKGVVKIGRQNKVK